MISPPGLKGRANPQNFLERAHFLHRAAAIAAQNPELNLLFRRRNQAAVRLLAKCVTGARRAGCDRFAGAGTEAADDHGGLHLNDRRGYVGVCFSIFPSVAATTT